MDARAKEQYLREYQMLKSKGKPFFPYAVTKDSVMAIIVLVVIIALTILFGAEIQPKADPTSTSYDPRPEWYFFFLFELLRVVKKPGTVFIATVGIPTICMILLVLLPFIDRNAERHPLRRPVATLAGITTILAMAYLTIEGALAGPPGQVTYPVAKQYEPGKLVFGQSGCQACHRIGEDGNNGPGPNLTHIGARLPRQAIARTLLNPTAPMPSFQSLRDNNPQGYQDLVNFLAALK